MKRTASGEIVVRLPSLDELATEWWDIATMLERATRRTGCYEPIDILQLAMAGKFGVWICEDDAYIMAVLVTEIVQYPRRRILEMRFAGGYHMRLWLKTAIAVIDEHARRSGCDHIACLGRRGWARAWGGEVTGDIVVVRGLDNVQR